MSQIKRLKFGSLILEFSKPKRKQEDIQSLVGILKTKESSVKTVRKIRENDVKRENERLQS